ncbi:MAG: hypothetical protein JWO92_328 [Chitinophagaceae bacterium]|nr:hypothetical protein [Chitinophagaceae bacterium]
MEFSTEISDELNNISSLLAGMEKKNVFSVPEEYFNELSINIFKKINTINSEFKTDKLTVPEGYFENLSSSVLNKIKSLQDDPAQELRTLSPMLYSIQNENVFRVPAGYFRNLENDILDKVITKPPTKIIELKKRASIWKYAAAAVVTGAIGVSSLMLFNTSKQSAAGKADDLSVSSSIKTASQFKNEQQVKTAIATLSDDEIIKYLEKTGTDTDNEALAAGIDENTLPAPNDYLLDEKTLDTYLNKTDKNSQN